MSTGSRESEASVLDHHNAEIVPRILIPQNEIIKTELHASNSWKNLETYFRNHKLTDVSLITGDKRISAHRLILSATSSYFATMFENSTSQSTQEEFVLTDIDGDALSALVEYCYTGSIELRGENIKTLLKTAHLLKLSPVVEACCQVLSERLDSGNCIGLKKFGDSQGFIKLSSAAHAHALEHFTDVIEKAEFLCLSAEEVAELLESEDISIPSEETVFNALVKWIQHDSENRSKDVSKLLSCISLPLLSPAFIAEHIESNELFRSQKAAQDSVVEALLFHLLPEKKAALIQSGRARLRKAFDVDVLLAIGQTSVDAYFAADDVWKNVTSTSDKREFFSSSIVENQLLVIGGRVNGRTTNTVKSFNFSNRSWNTLSPMNTPRYSCGAAVLDGFLYVVGGYDGSNSLNTVERWDPVRQRWSYVAAMPTSRSSVNVTVLNNKLYAVGSFDEARLSTLECYDPHTDKWTTLASMSKSYEYAAGVANEYLYILGGCGGTYLDFLERYDPVTDTLSTKAPMSVQKWGFGAGLLNNRLFTVGGYNAESGYINLVEAYDPDLNIWQEFAPLEVAEYKTCEVVKKSILNIE